MAKMQWNKINKDALETLGNFAVAVWELADKKALYADTYKARKKCYETDLADLQKLEEGKSGVMRTKAEIEASLNMMKETMERAEKAHKTLKKEIEERRKVAYELISENQFKAYENRIDKPEVYDTEISCFIKSLGVEPTDAGIRLLRDSVGEKEEDGKKVVKNAENMGLGTHKDEAYKRIFLKNVCREMIKAGCLKKERYTFEFKVETK